MKAHWRECAYGPCGRIFGPDDRPGHPQECCSQTCARKLQWNRANADRFAARFATFLEQPEVRDPVAIERAYWRVFGR